MALIFHFQKKTTFVFSIKSVKTYTIARSAENAARNCVYRGVILTTSQDVHGHRGHRGGQPNAV